MSKKKKKPSCRPPKQVVEKKVVDAPGEAICDSFAEVTAAEVNSMCLGKRFDVHKTGLEQTYSIAGRLVVIQDFKLKMFFASVDFIEHNLRK